mmetsp:Transcript_21056/g.65008  ORF Transcript_21056/g.65008 Transcript_21056/m.65008 type:complete len:168 (-) Transcript_21056:310-813(-)
MMTTRADEAGEAARASGAAVAVGFEKVSKMDLGAKARRAKDSIVLRKTEPEPAKEQGWFSRTWQALRPAAPRLERFGEARSAGEASEFIVRELADAPRDSRRRLANEIIASLHPDRTHSVAARATATALTRVALAVRDFFETEGWDVFDVKGVNQTVADVKKRVDRL